MKQLMVYLLQVMLLSGVFYGYYHFFLRNRRFHQYNRFYLLGSSLLSVLVPFMDIRVHFSSINDIPVVYKLLSEVRVGATASPVDSASDAIGLQEIGTAFYIIISVLLLVQLIVSVRKLVHLYYRSQRTAVDGIQVINTSQQGTPFSFFRWLFWNNEISIDSDKGQHIFRHELYHIRQRHSWDVMLLEIITIFGWINPFFHLMKKELRIIHEFLADEFASNGSQRFEYAELLLMETFQTRQRLVHPFFHNQIKRRIAMIIHPTTNGGHYIRKVMAFPIAFCILSITMVNCTTPEKEPTAKDETPKVELSEPAKPADSTATTPVENSTTPPGDPGKVYAKVEIEAAFPGGAEAWKKFLQENVNANVPINNGAPEGNYTIFAQFIVAEDGSISDLKPLTNHKYGMEEEVMRVMKLSPRWRPAINDGKAVAAYRKQPITFSVTAE